MSEMMIFFEDEKKAPTGIESFYEGDVLRLPGDPRHWRIRKIECRDIESRNFNYTSSSYMPHTLTMTRSYLCVLEELGGGHRRGASRPETLEIPMNLMTSNPDIMLLDRTHSNNNYWVDWRYGYTSTIPSW